MTGEAQAAIPATSRRSFRRGRGTEIIDGVWPLVNKCQDRPELPIATGIAGRQL
jgi:hypothetical protein